MRRLVQWRVLLGLALPGLTACTAPGGPGSEPFVPPGVRAPDAASDEVSVSVSAACLPPHAEALPGRIIETGQPGTTTTTIERPVFVTDLYARFRGFCGACHVDNSIGDFRVDIASFATLDLAKVRASIRSNDPAKFMPPPVALGKPWSDREKTPGDPVVRLLHELEQWFEQKTPVDVFKIKEQQTALMPSYAVGEEMALQQTNMGNCIPQRGMIGTQQQAMDDLDARFASIEDFAGLPDKLDQTDLDTLDSAELARKGVIAFAPAYPLWSEDSGKMRAIRVPRGQTVAFDKATQSFAIPENTRFYKTFLKKIVQRDGRAVWRKIETRLIVARNDTQEEGQPAQARALYGTYAWNEDETEAVLVRDPLRNGEPFADRLFTYVVDERRYREIVDAKPANLVFELNQERNKGVIRRYMIPGKQRCVECHMGSPMANFVLGFTPLQIRRRPQGTAGVYEEAAPDELNQLQRLIDYGVITGITSPSEIHGLEEPQGERKVRNQYELTAQAYLLGNCSHCHNPRGFPSVKSPELVDMLDFIPSDKGGVFQFPLDRVSPLRRRGVSQDVEVPYITPSLRDYPVADPVTADKGAAQGGLKGLWVPKWVDCLKGIWGLAFCDIFNTDDLRFIAAPWRSLMYRNVETPYIYADDFIVFPHMPRHSAGHDCRAPRILGDWMVSIPAVHKEEGAAYENNVRTPPFDTTAQPYEEVKPGDPRYLLALEGVAERLYEFRNGKRYGYCPDRSDIVVPEALTTTDPAKLTPPDQIQWTDGTKKVAVMPADAVPDRPHLVPSDLTETPGEWTPRRGDWQSVIAAPRAPAAEDREVSVTWALRGLRITPEMRAYATSEIPFGKWKVKPGCDLGAVKKARDYQGPGRPRWMDNPRALVTPDTPIYSITPGGQVFTNICVNCHGPQADSKGLLGEAISEMTGGDARVANFKDGIVGPSDRVGANIERVFGPIARMTTTAALPLTAEDWGARYLAWMALGGTQRSLPDSLVKIVGATLILGEPRRLRGAASANMLELARGLCANMLGWQDDIEFGTFFGDGNIPWGQYTGLVDKNGDAEMWMRLCTVGNRPVVRVPSWKADEERWTLDWDASLYWGEDYGKNPVMNHRGLIDADGIRVDNLMPTCVRQEDVELAPPEARLKTPEGKPYPICPAALFEPSKDANGLPGRPIRALPVVNRDRPVGREEWAIRGAANAGVAVLLYLEEVRRGKLTPKPGYDHCEQLKK